MPETRPPAGTYFALFNEIGILAQLSGALLEARLPRGFLISHFGVLNHLVRTGREPTPLELSRAFQVPKTTMTHTLAGLERAGLVRFAPNPRDGRSKRVCLTEAGQAFHADAVTAIAPDLARLEAAFPAARAAEALPVLAALREVMDRMRDTPDAGDAPP